MLTSAHKKVKEANRDVSNLSDRFRRAAFDGNRSLVCKLFPIVTNKDKFGIDVKIAFDLASGQGHLSVVKYLYHRLDPKSSAMSGLFEAARGGMILTVKWLLAQPDFTYPDTLPLNRDPKAAWQEGLSTAIKIAATNQHWGTMLELMLHANQYIKDRIQTQTRHAKCGLSACEIKHDQEKQDLLLIHAFDNLSVSTVYIPSSSHIPKPLLRKMDPEPNTNSQYRVKST
jgi:hypothetical protein